MKKEKFTLLFFSIFGIIGLFLLIGGIFWTISGLKFKKNAVSIPAVITDIESYRDSDGDTHHNVYVSYSYEGKQYDDIPLSEYSSSMYIGKEISLLCDPDHPGRVQTNFGIYFGSGMLLFMGTVFFLVGFIPLTCSFTGKTRKKKLLSSGHFLDATVEQVCLNTGYSVNGQNPYVLYCTYRDDYKDITYRFKSENLWTNPDFLFPEGSTVRVYVNPTDYSKYYVDVESAISGRIVDYT